MCTACEWAPHFAALSAKSTRRTALRAAVALTAGAAACSAGTVPAPTTGSADPQNTHADFVFRNGRVYTVAGPRNGPKRLPYKAMPSRTSVTRRVRWHWWAQTLEWWILRAGY